MINSFLYRFIGLDFLWKVRIYCAQTNIWVQMILQLYLFDWICQKSFLALYSLNTVNMLYLVQIFFWPFQTYIMIYYIFIYLIFTHWHIYNCFLSFFVREKHFATSFEFLYYLFFVEEKGYREEMSKFHSWGHQLAAEVGNKWYHAVVNHHSSAFSNLHWWILTSPLNNAQIYICRRHGNVREHLGGVRGGGEPGGGWL